MENTNLIKIFLVDDDTFALNLYQQYLLNLGYTDIETFENGIDCLNNMEKQPKVIFLDHQMEHLNGFEVLKKIKRIDPNVYVIVISAQENMNTAIDILKYGAFDYIIKGQEDTAKIKKVMERINEIEKALQMKSSNLFRKLFFTI